MTLYCNVCAREPYENRQSGVDHPATGDGRRALEIGRAEKSTMREFMSEAFPRYRRQREWDEANAYGRARAKQMGITEADVVRLIQEFRAERAPRRAVGRQIG